MQSALLALCAVVVYAVPAGAAEPEINFAQFWTRFRAAVLQRKWDEIKSYTQFPLKTHGVLDGSPKRKITESRFQTHFERFLTQRTFESNDDDERITISQEEKIRRRTSPYNNIPASHDWARVEDMQFHRRMGGWKLSLIYSDEE
jgi:hypothetical protein